MHLGNLRSALFGYLLARKMGGTFVLRIEDTDQERFVADAMDKIYENLRTAGISHDEGPDVGGDYGPYIQSERKSNYMDYAKKLIDNGAAYYCFCDKARLDGLEDGYDRHCCGLLPEAVAKNLADGMPFVMRQLIPQGRTTFVDEVFGEITVENAELEDQVLIKSDGMPTYNFANVVDDHMMAITHVMRGSEYLTSTPKYNLLYEALGWDIPTYVHLPLILSASGGKLSKRHGDAFFEDFLAKGFLPEAIVNYVVLLGWSPPDNREIYSLAELEQIFSAEGISKSPSTFDLAKLRWVNGEYLKAMDFDRFYTLAESYLADAVKKTSIDRTALAKMVQGRVSVLDDIPDMLDFIDQLPEYDTAMYIHKKSKCDEVIACDVLAKIAPRLAEIDESGWNGPDMYKFLTEFAAELELKSSQVLWPVRTALSGKAATPGGSSDLLVILGKDESLARIQRGLELLR